MSTRMDLQPSFPKFQSWVSTEAGHCRFPKTGMNPPQNRELVNPNVIPPAPENRSISLYGICPRQRCSLS